MVKGISRRVIVVDSPDPHIFEQAIFILRSDGGGVSQQQLVDQAVRIAKNYSRTHSLPRRRFPAALWAVIGACDEERCRWSGRIRAQGDGIRNGRRYQCFRA